MYAYLVQGIRFKLRDGFFCEVKFENEFYDFWLAHVDYGIMSYCFGLKVTDVPFTSIYEWMPEVEKYIDEFKESFFDE